MWVFPKIGGKPPKWMVKIMENPIKMDDLGGKTTPYFWFNTHVPSQQGIHFEYFSRISGAYLPSIDFGQVVQAVKVSSHISVLLADGTLNLDLAKWEKWKSSPFFCWCKTEGSNKKKKSYPRVSIKYILDWWHFELFVGKKHVQWIFQVRTFGGWDR